MRNAKMQPLLAYLVLATPGWASPLLSQETIRAGRTYESGTQLVSPVAGVSFAVSEGFRGAYDETIQGLVMGAFPNPAILVGVFAYSEGALDEVADAVAAHLRDVGVVVSPQGGGMQTRNRATGWFDTMSPNGPGLLYGSVQRGAPGNVIAVVALGTPPSRDSLEAAVERVTQSVQFSTPGAAAWRRATGGHAYTLGASGSDYSSGGIAGSGASGTTAQLDLCSDGTYGYRYHSETYVSIEGASASSENSDEHTGRWRLVSDIVGNATLVLEATDGREFLWPVEEAGDRVMIDGSVYGVSASERCQ